MGEPVLPCFAKNSFTSHEYSGASPKSIMSQDSAGVDNLEELSLKCSQIRSRISPKGIVNLTTIEELIDLNSR
jgi:hypothetical protein